MDREGKPEWAAFGSAVRRLRKKRGRTGVWVANAVGLSPTMYSSIERGKRFCLEGHAARIDEALQTGDQVMRLWVQMTSDQLPDWFYKVPELEQAASEIREYQPLVIPGLIQTKAYAKALFKQERPWERPQAMARMIEARTLRWELLDSGTCPLLWFVLSDRVLRSPVGSASCMREQLDHLVSLLEQDKVHLQVLPSTAPTPGKDGPFRIYGFPDKPTLASAEYMTGEIIIDTREKLRQCEVVFGALQAAALPPEQSLDQIKKARDVFT